MEIITKPYSQLPTTSAVQAVALDSTTSSTLTNKTGMVQKLSEWLVRKPLQAASIIFLLAAAGGFFLAKYLGKRKGFRFGK